MVYPEAMASEQVVEVIGFPWQLVESRNEYIVE
jgi:hypothetical protein